MAEFIVREWPAAAVIAENGAAVCWEEKNSNAADAKPVTKCEYHPNAVRNDHPTLERIKKRVLTEFPELRVAGDQGGRLFDIAFDYAETEPILPISCAERVCAIAAEEGARTQLSSVHVHILMGVYDKLSMAEHLLKTHFGWKPGAGDSEVVYAGDAPNDEPMFARFPLTCGVANVRRYEKKLKHLPAYVATKEYGEGFAEIAETILGFRNSCT
jgi:hydroxymethylpyrimidine pyrophosphatase-like HAD family hydrolase